MSNRIVFPSVSIVEAVMTRGEKLTEARRLLVHEYRGWTEAHLDDMRSAIRLVLDLIENLDGMDPKEPALSPAPDFAAMAMGYWDGPEAETLTAYLERIWPKPAPAFDVDEWIESYEVRAVGMNWRDIVGAVVREIQKGDRR